MLSLRVPTENLSLLLVNLSSRCVLSISTFFPSSAGLLVHLLHVHSKLFQAKLLLKCLFIKVCWLSKNCLYTLPSLTSTEQDLTLVLKFPILLWYIFLQLSCFIQLYKGWICFLGMFFSHLSLLCHLLLFHYLGRCRNLPQSSFTLSASLQESCRLANQRGA
jgi:hypothetical protein